MDHAARIAELTKELSARARTNRLELYRPYPFQERFHYAIGANGKLATQRSLMASNRCVSAETLIQHPDGSSTPAGILFERQKPFPVLSWDGNGTVAAFATRFYKKKPERLYRVTLAFGWFECSAKHQILLGDGTYASLEHLPEFSAFRLPSSSELSRLARAANVRRWSGKLQDWMGRCFAGSRLYDELLPFATDNGQVFLPSPNGAPQHIDHRESHLGGMVHTRASNLSRALGLPSIQYVRYRNAAQCAESKNQDAYTIAGRCLNGFRNARQFASAAIARLRQAVSSRQNRLKASSSRFSWLMGGNYIVSIQPVGVNALYDFSVPGHHNYLAGDVFHHNSGKTFSGAAETAMHATGRYPATWIGHRLTRPTKIWVGGKTHIKVRDICQAQLLGDPFDADAFGTGAIPKDCIVETSPKSNVPRAFESVQIRHALGHICTIVFKSYDSGAENWMGESVDACWLDEEPDQPVYSQALTRTLTGANGKGGIIYMTFTPENGATDVVEQFMTALKPNQALITATMRDALHLTPEAIESYLATLPPHERRMRGEGLPMLGEGAVWPVDWDQVICDPLGNIPRYWKRISAMDFGFNHPTGHLMGVWDTDNDVVYIVNEYKKAGRSIEENAKVINQICNSWVPIVWPHDMLKEHGAGDSFAAQYVAAGARSMCAEKFENPEGGNAVEPGLQAVFQRFISGKLKIQRDMYELLKEARIYHYKDGKVHRRNEDLCSCLRYLVQSLRLAAYPPAWVYGGRDERPQFAEVGPNMTLVDNYKTIA